MTSKQDWSYEKAWRPFEAASPVCSSTIKTFIMRDPDVLVMDIDETACEPVERKITLSRWGSRRFFPFL